MIISPPGPVASALYQLAYRSTAAPELDAAGMRQILEHARSANSQTHITGLLLVRERQVLQLLEGPEAAVRNVYTAIARDLRHQEVVLLQAGPLTQREFPDWAMAFAGATVPTELIPFGLVDASRQTYLKVRHANFSPATMALINDFLGQDLWPT